MNVKIVVLILVSVALSAIAQILFKVGMSASRIQTSLSDSQGSIDTILGVASSVHVWVGLFSYGLSAMLWLLVLARMDVSMAYPFVGLGFILTMVLGFLLLDEPVGITRISGTLLVVAGVILISRS